MDSELATRLVLWLLLELYIMLNVLELRLENEPRYELANVSVCEVLSAKDNVREETVSPKADVGE